MFANEFMKRKKNNIASDLLYEDQILAFELNQSFVTTSESHWCALSVFCDSRECSFGNMKAMNQD